MYRKTDKAAVTSSFSPYVSAAGVIFHQDTTFTVESCHTLSEGSKQTTLSQRNKRCSVFTRPPPRLAVLLSGAAISSEAGRWPREGVRTRDKVKERKMKKTKTKTETTIKN